MLVSSTRNFAFVLLVAFVATFLFCTWGINAMAMDEPMNDCATQQSQVAFCNVSPQDHLLAWQNFLPVSPQNILTLLATFLLAVVFLVNQRRLDSPLLVAQYIRTTALDGLSIVDPIRHALSRGIIQPQIYELVIS